MAALVKIEHKYFSVFQTFNPFMKAFQVFTLFCVLKGFIFFPSLLSPIRFCGRYFIPKLLFSSEKARQEKSLKGRKIIQIRLFFMDRLKK